VELLDQNKRSRSAQLSSTPRLNILLINRIMEGIR
jgi:hypothetical protein